MPFGEYYYPEHSADKENFPQQFWIVFDNPKKANAAYALLMHSEGKREFLKQDLLGYSFDRGLDNKGNENGIEINFKTVTEDMRETLWRFFADENLTPQGIYIQGSNEAFVYKPREKAKVYEIPRREMVRPKPEISKGKAAA